MTASLNGVQGKSPVVAARIRQVDADRLSALAECLGVPLSQVVRVCMQFGLAELEKDKGPPGRRTSKTDDDDNDAPGGLSRGHRPFSGVHQAPDLRQQARSPSYEREAVMNRVTPDPAIRPEPLVIDLSRPHPEGGHDPENPQFLAPFKITGLFMPAHTRAGDAEAPVVIRQGDIITPDAAQLADLRCTDCTASVTIGPLDGNTMALIEHAAGCAWFRRFLAEVTR